MARLIKICNLLVQKSSKRQGERGACPRLNAWNDNHVANSAGKQTFLGGNPRRNLRAGHRLAFWNSASSHFAGETLAIFLGFRVSRQLVPGSAVFFSVADVHQRRDDKTDGCRERMALLADFWRSDSLIVPGSQQRRERTC